jgi:hypothetical protein
VTHKLVKSQKTTANLNTCENKIYSNNVQAIMFLCICAKGMNAHVIFSSCHNFFTAVDSAEYDHEPEYVKRASANSIQYIVVSVVSIAGALLP